MSELLILRVPEDDEAPASWLLADATGAGIGSPQSGPLLLAAPLSATRRVIALVPGVDVLLAQPELPARSGGRLAQIVPFALEEQIAEDVGSMHFAIGRREASHAGTPVAAVSREKFETWLARLRAGGIEPHALHVDTTAVPSNPGQSVLVVDGDRIHVRHPEQPPFVLHAEPMSEALELAGLEATAETQRHAIAYLTQEAWQRHQAAFDAVRDRLASLKVQLLPHGVLPLFAREIQSGQPIDLLQGPYGRKSPAGEQWRQWRVAAFLLAGLVALNLLGKGVEVWRLETQERNLDAAMTQVFREAMPGEENAVDARRRMEARLAAVRGGSTGESLLEVLGVVGGAFSRVPDASIEAMSFRSNVLDLKVAAKDVASLDRLEHLVEEQGLQAELQSSNARGTDIEGRIQVRGRSAGPPASRSAAAGTSGSTGG